MEEYANKCRLCLEDGNYGVSIYAKQTAKNYAKFISQTFQIKMDKRDKWPSLACKDCVRTLDSIMGLRVKIFSSQERLRKCEKLSKKVKLEPATVTNNPPMETAYTSQEEVLGTISVVVPFKVETDLSLLNNLPSMVIDDLKTELPETAQIDQEVNTIPEIPNEQDHDHINRRQSIRTRVKTPIPKPLPEVKDTKPSLKDIRKVKKEQMKTEKAQKKQELDTRMKEKHQDYAELNRMLKDRNLLNCQECLIEYETITHLNKHAQIVHSARNCFITCCDEKFPKEHILDHMRYHRDPSAFTCESCAETFNCGKNLWLHERKVHFLHCKFQCQQCGRKCVSQSTLEKHLVTHVPLAERNLIYPCNQCGKSFALLGTLTDHIKSMHATKHPHICEKCGKAFAVAHKLRTNIKCVHEEKTKVECPVCHKVVTQWRQHQKLHQPKVYVPCEHCGREVDEQKMSQHIKNLHSGRKYTCQICDKVFNMRQTYTVHMDIHLGKRFKCRFCPFEATSTANRVKHHRHKHPVEYEEARGSGGL